MDVRSEIKKYIAEQKERIYTHPIYEILGKFPLYDPDYQRKNPTVYIHLHCRNNQTLQPVRLSKSFALYNKYDILAKMQYIAIQQKMIVAPAKIFHWRRREKLRQQYADFNAGELTYCILPENLLTKLERRKFIDFLRDLKWHNVSI